MLVGPENRVVRASQWLCLQTKEGKKEEEKRVTTVGCRRVTRGLGSRATAHWVLAGATLGGWRSLWPVGRRPASVASP